MRQRGTTLVEALLALVVTAFTALAALHLQAEVRRHADLTRQRAEAVRFGAAELERLRAFASIPRAPGVASYDAIGDAIGDAMGDAMGDASPVVDAASGVRASATYRLRTSVADLAGGTAKAVGVAVAWNDSRSGGESVTLASAIAGHDPALGASLSLGSGAGTVPGAHGRAHGVPIDATDLGDGTSGWWPAEDGTVALRFAHAPPIAGGPPSIALCEGLAPATSAPALTAAQLAACRPTFAGTSLVRGSIRFTDASPPDPAEAGATPLPTAVRLVLLGGGHEGSPVCWTRTVASGPEKRIDYACLVVPRADGRWSARAELVPAGWTIGVTAADHRVCRFAHDGDASGAIDAGAEHPRDWTDVRGSLVHQNFVVVRGAERCPGGGGIADPWHTDAHQP